MEAKIMFEQLGYDLEEKDEKEILYKMKWNDTEYVEIFYVGFDLEHMNFMAFKTVPFENGRPFDIDIDLLKAINQQCKELGWIE